MGDVRMRGADNPKMKSRKIAAALKQKIRTGKVPSGSPLPSARDLTKQYGVCMATANRALDILESEALIVRKKGSGNYVQKNIFRGHRLHFGLADVIGPPNPARNILIDIFPESAIACFKAENCDCHIVPYPDFRDRNLRAFSELDGLLLSDNYVDDDTRDFILSLKLPIVLYHAEYEMDLPFSQVIPDHATSMERLFSIAVHEKVSEIIILGPDHQNGQARARAFETYAKKYGFSDGQIRQMRIHQTDFREDLLSLIPDVRGKLVLSCSDIVTYDLIRLFREHGLICGQDYLLVGYDNLGKMLKMPPGIPSVTSIDYSRASAARTAAKMLIQLARKPNAASYQTVKFPTRLVIRESAFQSRKDLIL